VRLTGATLKGICRATLLRHSFILFLPAALLAQGVDVRGTVSDSATGEKIPFASVAILGTTKGAASNIAGFYLIPNVPPGKYQIVASSIGYERRTETILVGGREPIVLNFKLVSKPVEFSEIIVTDKAKRELTEINTSVHVLEQKDIHMVPIAVQEDILRAITILPGVVSTSDVNSHFYVRGGGGDQNLILLDGMKIYNPYHAFGIFSIFDPDVIKTTEVYTGAFPPGFGGRLSSVVSLTTREGKSTSISGRANMNLISSKLQLEGPITEDIHWLASGRKSLFNESFSRFLNRDAPLSFYDAFLKVTREVSELHSNYGFQGFYSGDELNSKNPDEPDYRWKTVAAGFKATGLIEDRLFVDAIAYENYFEANRDAKQSKIIKGSSTSVHEFGLKANATLYTNQQHLFFFGFEFSFPTLEYNLINSLNVPIRIQRSYVETWTWLRYQATIENLMLDGGIHLDVGDMFQRTVGWEVVQPRLNMSYLLYESWKAKFSYGKFNQNIITVNNEDDVIPIFDAWIQVPTSLRSEESDHVVFGVEGNILPTLSTSIQAYYKNYSALVSYNPYKVDALDPDYINSTGEASGVEVLFRYGIPLVDCYAAYGFGRTTITAGSFTYAPRYDRRHSLNLLTVFHPLEGLDISFRWELGSGFPFTQSAGYYDRLNLGDVFSNNLVRETGSPYAILGDKNGARLPAYHRLDASATYRFHVGDVHGSVGAHIINVYDKKNVFYFDRKTGQRVNNLSFFPSVTLSLEY
jgi:hypothetical protein